MKSKFLSSEWTISDYYRNSVKPEAAGRSILAHDYEHMHLHNYIAPVSYMYVYMS